MQIYFKNNSKYFSKISYGIFLTNAKGDFVLKPALAGYDLWNKKIFYTAINRKLR